LDGWTRRPVTCCKTKRNLEWRRPGGRMHI